jgi:uncharacterized membrane protein
MNGIITGFGTLLFIVGLVVGILSVIVSVHNLTPTLTAVTVNWHIEAEIAVVFLLIGVIMVTLGIKKF